RLLSLKEDPIKLVRGRAGIVFRAFTALPLWNAEDELDEIHRRSCYKDELAEKGTYRFAWKEFDIAAFKEALKVYNQFQQNIEKREEKLNSFATKLLVMDGERAIEAYAGASDLDKAIRARLQEIWDDTKGKPKPPPSESGEESTLPTFRGDARINRLRRI